MKLFCNNKISSNQSPDHNFGRYLIPSLNPNKCRPVAPSATHKRFVTIILAGVSGIMTIRLSKVWKNWSGDAASNSYPALQAGNYKIDRCTCIRGRRRFPPITAARLSLKMFSKFSCSDSPIPGQAAISPRVR